jgi:hypothetical protein
LKDEKKAECILKLCGSFAYSVDDLEGVVTLVEALTECPSAKGKATVQYVMGLGPIDQFLEVLAEAHRAELPVTLLGYKQTGRGPEVKPIDYSSWFPALLEYREHHWGTVSIDTCLAETWEPYLQAEGFPRWLYHTKEGAFSCYVDGVGQWMGPSSYCDEEDFIALPNPQWEEGEKYEDYQARRIKQFLEAYHSFRNLVQVEGTTVRSL